VHSFTRGLDLDIQAATAALTLPHHNGRTEGVNTKTKMIKDRCTDAPASPCCATASSPDYVTCCHHRKCDRAVENYSPQVSRGLAQGEFGRNP
jgi:hypothetical protein